MLDWTQIRMEYITTDTTYRQLAKKYGVSKNTISRRAKNEEWIHERDRYWTEIGTEVVQRVQECEIDEKVAAAVRINAIADRLLDKLEEAVEQLDRYQVQERNRCKTVLYDRTEDDRRRTVETVSETESRKWISGDIDREGLKKLASSLKDIREIKGMREDDRMDSDETGVIVLGERDDNDGQESAMGAATETESIYGED